MNVKQRVILPVEMVDAVLNGEKTVFRTLVSGPALKYLELGYDIDVNKYAPYAVNDNLWVAEPFSRVGSQVHYLSKDKNLANVKPASQMPKQYARIFLKVENVGLAKFIDADAHDALLEGFQKNYFHSKNIACPISYDAFVKSNMPLTAMREYYRNKYPKKFRNAYCWITYFKLTSIISVS